MEKQRSYPELMDRFRRRAEETGATFQTAGAFECPLGRYDIHFMRMRLGAGTQRICISTGMHGDEPAGPETLLEAMRRLRDNANRLDADILLFPCDNPTGWELNTRENWQGRDLNREFMKQDQAEEIRIVEAALAGQRFDFTLDIHEDIDTYGMYLYERARPGRASLAEEMIAALRRRGCPIEESDVIEGLPASGGIIVPKGPLRRSNLPKAVYFWHHGVLQLITTESPGKLDLDRRVEMQLICLEVFMEALAAGRFVRPEAVTWDI
ncbi:MAG: hypothetical protein KatS3mg024_1891 [Armatimonadota bacterium]|nr:MAG: hypothetical protein KatS3mg024_1891 [Armatimonadota bacterium]